MDPTAGRWELDWRLDEDAGVVLWIGHAAGRPDAEGVVAVGPGDAAARVAVAAEVLAALGGRGAPRRLDAGPGFVVMEPVTGPSFAEIARGGALGAEHARALLAPVADALAAAHALGWRHGALTAAKIRLDRLGRPRVLGWDRASRGDGAVDAAALADVVRALGGDDPELRAIADALAADPGPLDGIARRLAPRGDPTAATGAPEAGPAPVEGPRLVGRYEIRGELGRGGMGVVYRAYDPVLDREVALKLTRSTDVRRFEREMRAVARLDHPGIVRVLDSGRSVDGPYYTMELVDGPSLDAVLRRRGPLPWRDAVALALDVAAALGHAHAQGFVHRDVKPGNVLVDPRGRARLTDFGLAVHADASRVTGDGQVLGTPRYMAPEQVTEARVDARADVWALGVVLYELVTGRTPFEGTGALLVQRVLDQPAPPLAGAPTALARAVARALEKAPEDRYPDIGAFAADLARARDGQAVAASSPSSLTRATRWMRRHPGVSATLGAAVVGSLGFVIGAPRSEGVFDAAARDSYAELSARVAALDADGHAADADAAFEAWASNEDWRGTPALAQAWAAHAARLDTRGDDGAHAWAVAYAEGVEGAARADALVRLGDAAYAEQRWADVDAAVAHPDPSVARDPRWLALVRRAAWARHAPVGAPAADTAEPALAALLSGARLLELPGTSWGRIGAQGGAAWLWNWEEHRAVVVDRAGVRPFAAMPGHAGPLVDPAAGIGFYAPQDGSTSVGVWADGAFRAVGSVPGSVNAGALADVDGDGALDWLASDDGGPALVAWVRGERVDLPFGPDDAIRSSGAFGVVSGDLDGDGRAEVAVGTAQWGTFDLRVYRGEGGRLRLLARDKVGMIKHVAIAPRAGGGQWILGHKTDDFGSRQQFPVGSPDGVPAGVYAWTWAPDRGLERRTLVEGACWEPIVGDFDGDGRADVAVRCGADTWVGRQGDDGFAGGFLRDVWPVAAVQLDDDPAEELVVTVQRSGRTWALGVGATPMPIAFAPPLPAVAPPTGTGAAAARWGRAEELVSLGRIAEAEEAFTRLAERAGGTAVEGPAWLRAGDLLARRLGCEEATPAWTRAAARPTTAVEADRRVATCAVQGGAWAALAAPAARLAAAEGVPPDERARWAAWAARAAASGVEARLTFDPAHPGPWRIATAVALSGEPKLRIEALDQPLLRVPVRQIGEAAEVSVTVDVDRLEWPGALRVRLVPRSGGVATETRLYARGGGGRFRLVAGCASALSGGERSSPFDGPAAVGPVTLTVRFAASDTGPIGVCRHQGPSPWTHVFPIVAGDTWDLEIDARGDGGVGFVSGEIRAIDVRGFEPLDEPKTPEELANEALFLDDPAGALRLAPPGLARLVAAQAVGDRAAVGAAARALPVGSAAAWLRGRPSAARPALREALGVGFYDVFSFGWDNTWWHTPRDPVVQEALQRDVDGAERVPPGALDADGMMELLRARAEAARSAGRLSAARLDLEAAGRWEADARTRARLALARARLALATGDREAAIGAVLAALATAPFPELVADPVAVDPAYAALHDDPRWAQVAAARRLRGE